MSNDEDDDDDVAELFSFGAGSPAPDLPVSVSTAIVDSNDEKSNDQPTVERIPSNDSFLDLLESEVSGQPASTSGGGQKAELQGADQEILDWLEDEQKTLLFTNDDVIFIEETGDVELPQHIADSIARPATPPPPAKPLPPPPEPEPVFDTLVEALQSPKASLAQIRKLSAKQKIDATLRPNLWCRLVCGKSLGGMEKSSLADSFQEWQDVLIEQDETEVVTKESKWIHREAPILANRIVMALDKEKRKVDVEQAEKDVRHLLLFHYHSSTSVKVAAPDNLDEDDDANDGVTDPLIPPVACAILSAGIPAKVASVMLATIMPTHMPLLALTDSERLEAAKSLHTQFYLLACYHLPLLVLHLDRYVPGWHCPKRLVALDDVNESATQKGRNLEAHGVVPQSWLISHLAGECNGTFMNPKWLLSLWDAILTSSNNSLRFFLALAVLEKHAESLLLLTGDELLAELHRIMEFKEGTTNEGFSIEAEEETTAKEAEDWVEEWTNRAQSLFESTPSSVVTKLRAAEDNEVAHALERRQKLAEEKLKAKMEAQARAHREAVEAERERVADEARERLTRARLVAYYRNFNPDKEGNIDTIMKNYAGRYEVLDAKLKAKYGVGFNPALRPKPAPKTAQNLLATMGQGFGSRRDTQHSNHDATKAKNLRPQQVSLSVTASEVLPSVCWSKEAKASRGSTSSAASNGKNTSSVPLLKYYLVDSRSEAAAEQQGRFPTAAQMGPEVLLDPERIQQKEESFESLRSAVHICVMGEGYAALPGLYGHKVNAELEALMKEDESQTSNCALFFIKKGFPFVSTLEGGFARAHAWLVRQGPNHDLDVESSLVDYDPSTSLFAQFERLFKEQQELANATTRERTQRALQSLFDGSMASLTKNKLRLENLASELDTGDVGQNFRTQVTKLFVKSDESPRALPEQQQDNKGTTPPGQLLFRYPFTKLQAVAPEQGAGAESTGSGTQTESTNDLVLDDAQTQTKPAVVDQPTPSPTAAAAESMANRLAGLGAALNMTLKSSTQQGGGDQNAKEQTTAASVAGLKRNPFARFGALVAETARGTEDGKKNEQESAGLGNRFGGWNALRKNTLARIRTGSDKPAQDSV